MVNPDLSFRLSIRVGLKSLLLHIILPTSIAIAGMMPVSQRLRRTTVSSQDIQCVAIITRSVFFKSLISDTPQVAREGEVRCDFCEYKLLQCCFIISFYIGHYSHVKMGAMAYQITSITIVYSTVYSGADQRKYQSSTSLAFVRGIHRWPVKSPHKWSGTRKMFPFDDATIDCYNDTRLYITLTS